MRAKRILFKFFTITIIVFALCIIGLRLGVSNIDFIKTEFEFWLAKEVIPGVSFVSMGGGWNHFNPVLRLNNASITLPDRSQPLVIDDFSLEFDLYKSIALGTPVVREATGNIDKIILRRDQRNNWFLNNIKLTGDENSNADVNYDLLLAQIPYFLRLNVDRLIIENEAKSSRIQLNKVGFDIQHINEAIEMQVVANLPDEAGQKLDIRSILTRRDSLIYVNAEQLRIDYFNAIFDFDLSAVPQTEMSAEMWVNIINKQIRAASGKLQLSGKLKVGETQSTPVDMNFTTQFQALRGKLLTDWTITSRVEGAQINRRPWGDFDVQLNLSKVGGQLQIEGLLNQFELANLQDLPDFSPNRFIKQIQPRSRLSDIRFAMLSAEPAKLKVAASFNNFSSKPYQDLPGIENLNGVFTYGDNKLNLELSGEDTRLDFSDRFRSAIILENLKLQARVYLGETGARISIPTVKASNKDISLSGRSWLEIEPGTKPFMYLRADFKDGVGSSVSKYLPIKLLPEKILAWLDSGIIDAQVTRGGLLFHGRLENIVALNKRKSGELYVDFDLRNAEVKFSPDWESAKNGRGKVLFHNLSMDIGLDNVGYDVIPDARAEIKISNLVKSALDVKIDVDTSTSAALSTWVGTPVGSRFREIISQVHNPRGKVQAKIDISIPLDKVENAKVNVLLGLNNAAAEAPDWGVDLSQINGSIKVTESTLTAQGIDAIYFNDPIKLDIRPDPIEQETVVHAYGLIDTQQLLHQLPQSLVQGFAGRSEYSVDIAIPENQSDPENPVIRIDATSKFVGTQSYIPEPFMKTAADEIDLSTEIRIFDDTRIEFGVKYGPDISARGESKPVSDGGYRLAALDIGFSSPLKPELDSGIRLYGTLAHLPLKEWVSFYRSLNSATGEANQNRTYLELADLRFHSITALNRQIEDSDVFLIRAGNSFQGEIKSSLLKGKFSFPWEWSGEHPVVVDLEYLKLKSVPDNTEKSELIPSDLPSLQLNSKNFVYDDMSFTDLSVTALQTGELFEIQSLRLRHDDIVLQSNAKWQYDAASREQSSNIDLSLNGSKIGQAISSLGLGDVMLNGEIALSARFGWSASIFNFDWDSLVGDGTLSITDGILRDVDPGSGRFVGLLSLNALPRRLFLDFSDLIVEGLEFDKISGTYELKGENLITHNTKMDGASATVIVTGKTGLRNRDYDQKMVITPKVRQTLPVIGSIAAGNAVGWGLLLLQNLFKKQIDETVEIEYRVSGTWDDPKVDLVTNIEDKKRIIDNDRK